MVFNWLAAEAMVESGCQLIHLMWFLGTGRFIMEAMDVLQPIIVALTNTCICKSYNDWL